mgnify:CR=1 FL=1
MKVVVIGLDGATWDILIPLTRNEKLSTLNFLLKEGSFGTLESTIPPVTGCAWLSIATGLNPGKTGIIDFLKKDVNFGLTPVNSLDFRNKSFWDLLSLKGKNCVVLDYPMLYPAYPLKGAIISTWGKKLDTFPEKLKQEIQALVGDYDIFVNYHDEKYDDINLFLRDLNVALNKKIKVTEYLLEELEWDLFVNIISFTDWIQHRMWHYIDESYPLYDEAESRKIRPYFIDFWKRIDDLIGKMLKHTDYMFIVSDHGFGPQYGCFNLLKWLEKKGYIVRKRGLKPMLRRILSTIANTPLRNVLPEKVKKRGRTFLSIATDINLSKSKVYVIGHTIPFGALYINLKNRNPEGVVDEGKEYEELKRTLINSLLNLKNDINREIEVTVYDTKKIYSGNKIEVLPDIIFTINNWSCVIVKDFKANFLYKDAPYSNRHTGSHRLNGIFLAYGPDIRNGFEAKGLKIYDIAPTILHMFNAPIPKNVDGRVLTEIFKPESKIAKRKPKYMDESFKERTRAKIKELKKLGKI